MAFDLVGENPKDYDGEWIRFNIWTWHRIWRGVIKVFPDIAESVEEWYHNSNQLVPASTAVRLAKELQMYGEARFAKAAAEENIADQMLNIGDRTVEAHILFEMDAFIKFLYSCNGFRIK